MNLWDTENGPDHGDEINLVEPGFNSGWKKFKDIISVGNALLKMINPDDLVNFNGKRKIQ